MPRDRVLIKEVGNVEKGKACNVLFLCTGNSARGGKERVAARG